MFRIARHSASPTAILALTLAFIVAAIAWSAAGSRDGQTSGAQHGPRIVSVAPSVTEILFALGVGEQIVGVTDHCDYPAAAKDIEQVGGFGAPSVEKLLQLSPDVVLAAGLERPEIAGVLRGAGIRVVNVSIRNVEDLFAAVGEIGAAIDRTSEAEQLVARMRAQLAALAARRKASASQRPRVFVEIWDDPLTTVGRNSYVDDLIAYAGGSNVAGQLAQAYPHVSPEKVVEWNPEVILVTGHVRSGDAAELLARRIGWSNIAAVKQRRIVDNLDPDLLLRPGPRLVEGAEALAARLFPADNEGIHR